MGPQCPYVVGSSPTKHTCIFVRLILSIVNHPQNANPSRRNGMSGDRTGQVVIGRTVGKMQRSCCSVISMGRGSVLRVGDKLRFLREGGGVTEHLFHDTTHLVESIQVNDDPRDQVTASDGNCSIKIGELPIPPVNCTVFKLLSE